MLWWCRIILGGVGYGNKLILDLNKPRVVAVIAFTDSLFQTAGVATEKEHRCCSIVNN